MYGVGSIKVLHILCNFGLFWLGLVTDFGRFISVFWIVGNNSKPVSQIFYYSEYLPSVLVTNLWMQQTKMIFLTAGVCIPPL